MYNSFCSIEGQNLISSEVTDDEYNAFYKSFAKDTEPPMIHSHFTAEGE
ncbi:unnamed protein product, partial [Rotaria magnacalcarata]